MAIDPDIRDQAYQFFIEEVPELLRSIETELLALKGTRDLEQIHTLMRVAHSLKGGAASVELEAIEHLAHRLEDCFKALYSDSVEIDPALEELLLQAYDCLRVPLMEQISTGQMDAEAALATGDAVFARLDACLGDAIAETEQYIPGSADFGVDIAESLFSIDVSEGLDRLRAVLANPTAYEVVGELRAQAEVFGGFAEMLNLPGFGSIAQAALSALDAHPDRALVVLKLALEDFCAGRDAVLAGDLVRGGAPSPTLLAFANGQAPTTPPDSSNEDLAESSHVPAAHPPLNFEEAFSAIDNMELADSPAMGDIGDDVENEISLEDDLDWFGDLISNSGQGSEETALGASSEAKGEVSMPPVSADDVADSTPISLPNDESDTDLSVADMFSTFGGEAQELSEAEETSAIADLQSIPDAIAPDQTAESPLFLLDEAIDYPESADTLSSAVSETGFSQQDEACEEELAFSPKFFAEVFNEAALIEEEAPIIPSPNLEAPPPLDEIFGTVSASDLLEDNINLQNETIELPGYLSESLLWEPEVEASQMLASETEESDRGETSDRFEVGSFEASDFATSDFATSDFDAWDAAIWGDLSGNNPQAAAGEDVLDATVQEIEQIYDRLPPVYPSPNETPQPSAAPKSQEKADSEKPAKDSADSLPEEPSPTDSSFAGFTAPKVRSQPSPSAAASSRKSKSKIRSAPTLSVRVNLQRLERMNNQISELSINRNSMALQNEQLQSSVRQLRRRFETFQRLIRRLQKTSDGLLASDDLAPPGFSHLPMERLDEWAAFKPLQTVFDALEMDRYTNLHAALQATYEEVAQIEEAVDDIVLFARQSDRLLEQQRQMVSLLRDDLMRARMLPLEEILTLFPRILRNLSKTYRKPVQLKVTGTGVLVDKAVLERLYDPLLHLLRNAFDHGIESAEIREQQGKDAQGTIEIRAYHQGNQTLIEVKDDGSGVSLDRIRHFALKQGLASEAELATMPDRKLVDFIFEPGFSTASRLSELSGRGVGLDVVRSQLRDLKGTITVTSIPNQGTNFTLRLPLTLTMAQLLVCSAGSSMMAFPADSIEEIVVPKAPQMQLVGDRQFLRWRDELLPTYRMVELLGYNCPVPDTAPSRSLTAVTVSLQNAIKPLLVVRRERHYFAVEVDRLISEQELTIKPFGSAIAPPSYTYGCTILGDGSVIPVIEPGLLVERVFEQVEEPAATPTRDRIPTQPAIDLQPSKSFSTASPKKFSSKHPAAISNPAVLVVDDSTALRRMLTLSLEKAGYRVLQAGDGRQAIEQLRQTSTVRLAICDIEMPNMNGFEFLSERRRDPNLATIPVVILTSRSNAKHRQLALHLGANDYFTKPYIEQEFLSAIQTTIAHHHQTNAVQTH